MFGRKNSNQSEKFEDEMNQNSKILSNSQGLFKDLKRDSDDEKNNPYSSGRKKRFNKGLKMLSVIVKDIVIDKKVTTYKEVADIILKDSLKYDNLNLSSK